MKLDVFGDISLDRFGPTVSTIFSQIDSVVSFSIDPAIAANFAAKHVNGKSVQLRIVDGIFAVSMSVLSAAHSGEQEAILLPVLGQRFCLRGVELHTVASQIPSASPLSRMSSRRGAMGVRWDLMMQRCAKAKLRRVGATSPGKGFGTLPVLVAFFLRP